MLLTPPITYGRSLATLKISTANSMSTKQARGTKRTCQSNECGARFYDLNRDPIACPICGSIYELASSPLVLAAAEEKSARKARKVDVPKVATAEAADTDADTEAEDTLADIETDDGDEIAAEADETFLEEEEEGGDVATIIGPVEGDEEP
jgi:uncharacterized protein (TIGR02300 family)